jgi:ABC-2 type transport system ATP-binding protein
MTERGASAKARRVSSPAVRCTHLVKRFDDVVAVDGLDLEVRRGECLGLLGPNGAGKTTTVEILEGLLEPTDGDVEILGRRWSTDADWLRGRIGLALQETHLSPKLSVRETLELFRSFYGSGPTVASLLDELALGDKADARYETLSGGQKQRLAVGCALVGAPELLFLDEPTTGLDPQSRRMLWEVVHGFKARGGSVVLTTHYMDEAERLCDRVAVVDHGKRIALGTPAELIASLGGEQVIELVVGGELDAAFFDGVPGIRSARAQAGGWLLAVDSLHEALPACLARIAAASHRLEHLTTHAATLEDVFVHLTGRHLRE